MSIRRARLAFESQFVQIPNEWLRDTRLSRRARGLLAEIMTHESGWEITIESLVEKGPEGRDALRAAIRELEDAGYLRRERQKTDGKFSGMDYVLQMPPETLPIPSVGKSNVGKTCVGESATKNTKLLENHQVEHQGRGKPSRATSLPASFEVTEGMQVWALEKAPGIDLVYETEKFRNYHQSKGSTFKDWTAAWRTWIQKAVEYRKENQPTSARASIWGNVMAPPQKEWF